MAAVAVVEELRSIRLRQALVEGGGDGGAVEVLADEDELLHVVAVGVICDVISFPKTPKTANF